MAKPELVAHFVLDGRNRPQMEEAGKTKHYSIVLSVSNAPSDTYAVNYGLHETYYDPNRESRDSKSGFAQEITSYGDFVVQVKLRTKGRVQTLAARLAQALRRGHGPTASAAIDAAIEAIEAN